jgi:hypothetical protein
MSLEMKHFRVLAVTVMFILGWVTVLGFTLREWHAERWQIQTSMAGLVISYPLSWISFAKDNFVSWQMAFASYVALLNALLLILFLAHSG